MSIDVHALLARVGQPETPEDRDEAWGLIVRELELRRAQVELFRGFITRVLIGDLYQPNRKARTILNRAEDWETGAVPIGETGLSRPPEHPQQLMRRGGDR